MRVTACKCVRVCVNMCVCVCVCASARSIKVDKLVQIESIKWISLSVHL